jgi:hypothetical protein
MQLEEQLADTIVRGDVDYRTQPQSTCCTQNPISYCCSPVYNLQ